MKMTMRGTSVILTALWLAAAIVPSHAQDEESTPPIPVDKTERAEVRLVLLDTVVIDSDGNPVAGLEKEDFEIRRGGEIVSPDVLETRCDSEAQQRQQMATGAGSPRSLILAFDYLHMPMLQREWALSQEELSTQVWTGMLKPVIGQLVAYGKGGIKQETVIELLKLLGLSAIATKVGD